MTEITEDPKTWPKPNYEDPETLVDQILGVTIATLVIMMIFMTGRIYGRTTTKARIGWDDWVMIVATILCLVQGVLVCLMTKYGCGYHIWDLKPWWPMEYQKHAMGVNVLFALSVSVTKVSICITYLRLFPTKLDKIFSWTMIVYSTAYGIAVGLCMLLECDPIAKMWNPELEGSCINFRLMLLITGIMNSFSDCLVYLWPIRALWGLQLPKKQKVGLVIMFAFGITVCVAGIIRVWYDMAYFTNWDAFYGAAYPSILTSLECNVGVICGCIPGIKPILHLLFPRFFSTYGSARRTYGPNTYGSRSGHLPSGRRSRHLASSGGGGQHFPFQTLSGGTHDEGSLKKNAVGIAVTDANPASTPDSGSDHGRDIERDAGARTYHQHHAAADAGPGRLASMERNRAFARGGAGGHRVPDGHIGVSREVHVTSEAPPSDDSSEEWIIQGDRKQ